MVSRFSADLVSVNLCSLREIGLDVQLKILQSLPSLLQNYGNLLEGELQAMVLQLCTALQQVKNSAVSGTASATLQQIITSLYDKVEAEDGTVSRISDCSDS